VNLISVLSTKKLSEWSGLCKIDSRGYKDAYKIHFVMKITQVKQGQVICIVEVMKLMNESEVDRSGTIVEILVEDSEPVAVDMPLFVIKP
jgi:biotin carboxyl carrier protein